MKILKKKYTKKFRLSIFKSNKHLYSQLINDKISKTLASTSTLKKDIKSLNISKKEKIVIIAKDIALKILNLNLNLSNIFFSLGTKRYKGLISKFINEIQLSILNN